VEGYEVTRRASKLLGLALAVLAASAALGQEGKVAGRILAITDGDTVKALIAGNQLLRMTFELVGEPHDGFMFEADP
jgi:hypothetical protein